MVLTKKTISELHSELTEKKISASELLAEYKKNIADAEEEINAFVSMTESEAEQTAQRVDEMLNAGKSIQQVSGIPAALKDNFNWKDTVTTASSFMLDNYVSPYNATVTERLLNENAVFVGKANMDAFAHGSSTETSDYGVTLNPYNTDHVAGGSSGGSAAAVAANMSCYAIGSETAGSVRGPAAWCGLYGFAPTYGRISRYGVVAMGSSLDRPGVLANSVEDCALVTDVIAGRDENDATTIQEDKTNYYSELKPEVKGMKLGLPKQFLDDRIDDQVRTKVSEAIDELEKMGAEIIEIDLMDPKYTIAMYTIISRSEISSNLARIDGIRYGHYSDERAKDILDQISINRGDGFGNEAKQRSMTGAYALSAGYYDAYYKKAQKVRTLIIEDFKQAFEKVDLIVGPTMPNTAPKLGVTEDNPLYGEIADMLTEPSAMAGLPCISVPVGKDSNNLPIGMQFFGPQYQEQRVLNLAYAFEQHTK